jgi:hypothetical protein
MPGIHKEIRTYENGVQNIIRTGAFIETMGRQLPYAIPVLEQAHKEGESNFDVLQIHQKEVEGIKQQIKKQSKNAEEEAVAAASAKTVTQG